MSFQIYYKFKKFANPENGVYYIFSLDGANNGFFAGPTKKIKERDWNLFYRGKMLDLLPYIKKIQSFDGWMYGSKWITDEELYKKLYSMRSAYYKEIPILFPHAFIQKIDWSGFYPNVISNRRIELSDLDGMLQEKYFLKNIDGETLVLVDEYLDKIYQSVYGYAQGHITAGDRQWALSKINSGNSLNLFTEWK